MTPKDREPSWQLTMPRRLIRWELIFHALKIFGFGEFIITVVKMLFKDIRSCTYNSGFTSDLIFPTRDIRQGCCSSPTLFTLVVELLATLVRNSLDIKGIDMAGQSIRISQYADDSTFFVGNLEPAKISSHASGPSPTSPAIVEGIKVVDKAKILGIYFKNKITEDEQYALNYQAPLTKISNTCQAWSNRTLSLKGKVTLVNSLMISLMQYPLSCTPVPKRALAEYKKIIVDFIWSSKRSKIAYDLLIQDIKHGGLRLADLEMRIRTTHISLIRRAWLNPELPWAIALREALGQESIQVLLRSKAKWVNVLNVHYAMFKDILTSWEAVHNFDPDTEEMVHREVLWNNQSILIAKKPVYWHTWYQAGIETIADLWHEQEACFLSHEELNQRFGIQCSFLNALQIRTAIPVKWKRLLLNPAPRNLSKDLYIRPATGDYIKITNSSSKAIYGALVLCRKPSISAQQKWATIYPHIHPNLGGPWDYVYQAPYRATRETKYQAFQYKIHKGLFPVTDIWPTSGLNSMTLLPFAFCDEVDTIQHFLFECEETNQFWTQVCNWVEQNTGLQIDISQQ